MTRFVLQLLLRDKMKHKSVNQSSEIVSVCVGVSGSGFRQFFGITFILYVQLLVSAGAALCYLCIVQLAL